MNEVVNEKGVFQLKDLVPYGEEQIINKGLIENDKVRFAVISLAKGSTLPDHAAPRDALLFALDGEAVFTHEGKDYVFKAGDNFAMRKGDRHHIQAATNFKFALLLTEPEYTVLILPLRPFVPGYYETFFLILVEIFDGLDQVIYPTTDIGLCNSFCTTAADKHYALCIESKPRN